MTDENQRTMNHTETPRDSFLDFTSTQEYQVREYSTDVYYCSGSRDERKHIGYFITRIRGKESLYAAYDDRDMPVVADTDDFQAIEAYFQEVLYDLDKQMAKSTQLKSIRRWSTNENELEIGR